MTPTDQHLESKLFPLEEGLFARINLGDVTTSLQPHGDSIGKVFAWQGKLYRAIKIEHSPLYRTILKNGMLDDLVSRGLFIPTWQVEEQLTGYDLVVQHQRLPHVVYPTEWCWSMMRDAAVATLDVQIEALKHSATLADAHPWNVVFRGAQPVLVDLTAISDNPADHSWPGEESFVMEFLRPLVLMGSGRTELAHLMLNISADDARELWQLWVGTARSKATNLASRILRRAGVKRSRRVMNRAIRWRKRLAAQGAPTLPKPAAAGAEHSPIVERIAGLAPASVLVINENRGHGLSVDLARKGIYVLSAHRNSDDAEALYQLAKADVLNLLPIIADTLSGTSTFGLFTRPDRAGMPARLRSDLVVFPVPSGVPGTAEAWMTFDQRIEAATVYANRCVAIELHNTGSDFTVSPVMQAVLQRHFVNFEQFNLPSVNRVWLIGRVKS